MTFFFGEGRDAAMSDRECDSPKDSACGPLLSGWHDIIFSFPIGVFYTARIVESFLAR